MGNPTADFVTSLGTMRVELFADKMPKTTANFIKLAKSGVYDGLHFHRVKKGLMRQFGCTESRDQNSQKAGTGNATHGTTEDEQAPDAKISIEPGTLSLANADCRNSGIRQFFM